MLGTEKGAISEAVLPDEVREINALMENEGTDREALFLNQAAIAFNYRQSGFVPLKQAGINQQTALSEEKAYCPAIACRVLNDILHVDNIALLTYWLANCIEKNWIIPPEFLTVLLDKARQHVLLRSSIAVCSGNRGIWLGRHNRQWDFFKSVPDDELWQTGNTEQRVQLLQRLRVSAPEQALEWLQQTWPQETAAAKLDLIKTISINSSAADLPWLEGLLAEKSQKLKDEVLTLLKQIPGSSVIQRYEAVLREAVVLKSGKALFGMLNKTSLQVKLPDSFDEGIFKTGIEKLSSNKAINDNDFIIYQLIKSVPPVFWEQQFAVDPAQVVDYFEKYAPSLTPALAQATFQFKAAAWVPYFLNGDRFYPEFINLLPASQREKYLLKFLNGDRPAIIQHALISDQEWGQAFSLAALLYMANYPYQFNRAFYSQQIQLFPVGIIGHLAKIDATDANLQPGWNKLRSHIIELLTIKQQIQQAFNL